MGYDFAGVNSLYHSTIQISTRQKLVDNCAEHLKPPHHSLPCRASGVYIYNICSVRSPPPSAPPRSVTDYGCLAECFAINLAMTFFFPVEMCWSTGVRKAGECRCACSVIEYLVLRDPILRTRGENQAALGFNCGAARGKGTEDDAPIYPRPPPPWRVPFPPAPSPRLYSPAPTPSGSLVLD